MDACERFSSRAENSLAESPFWTRIHSLKFSVMGLSRLARPLEKWKKVLSTRVITIHSSEANGRPKR